MWKIMPFLIYATCFHIQHKISIAEPMKGNNLRQALKNEFEFIVSIRFTSNDVSDDEEEKLHFCGGSLITRKHVLTAAHCVKKFKVYEYEVTIGTTDLRKGKQYSVECHITYEEWAEQIPDAKPYKNNDIAIIQLKDSVGLTHKLGKLTEKKTDEFFNTVATVAGWGATDKRPVSRFLLTANLNIITRKQCRTSIMNIKGVGKEPKLQKTYLCTQNQPHTILGAGDSGSPLFINGNEIIGFHRSAIPKIDPPCPISQLVMIFEGIDHYRTFIEANTNLDSTSCCCVS